MNPFKWFWKGLTTPMPQEKHDNDWLRKRLTAPVPGEKYENEALSNYTPRAQQVLALARKEADRFHHNFVGTERLLLGLISLGQGVAVNVLQTLGLDLETVRIEVEKQVGTGPDQKMIGNIPYTPRVRKVLLLAAKEAKSLNHTYVGTEHILLGLLREGDGVAARVLKNLDVDIDVTRQNILQELDPNFSAGDDPANRTKSESPSPHSDMIDLTTVRRLLSRRRPGSGLSKRPFQRHEKTVSKGL